RDGQRKGQAMPHRILVPSKETTILVDSIKARGTKTGKGYDARCRTLQGARNLPRWADHRHLARHGHADDQGRSISGRVFDPKTSRLLSIQKTAGVAKGDLLLHGASR